MADELDVTPTELRSVAGDLDDVAGRVRGVLDTLSAACGPHWGRWGADEFGTGFSGDNGYIASDANLHSAVGSKVDLLTAYAGGLRQAAGDLDGMEDHNRTLFDV